MARIRDYGQVIASPRGRSFYSNPRKRIRRARAPITPALKNALAKQHEIRRTEYTLALKDARDAVHKQATQLREVFGGHSVDYYIQEILQRGRLERARWGLLRWNTYLGQEVRTRNSGREFITLHAIIAKPCPKNCPKGSGS